MSMLTKDGNFPRTSSSTSQEAQESSFTGQPPISALRVTLLSSEWRSTKGGLSTINRELAIQLAKHSNVEVSMYLPQCSEEDKRAAAAHNVRIIEAEEIPGYDPIDWLASIPRDHQMDFVIGHGIHLGRQVPIIKRVHRECKWIQVVHTDPEELGVFKNLADSIAEEEKKHETEVKLCKLADQVVAIGPKLAEAFSRYLRFCGKDQDVLNLTPGIFSEFADVTQAAEESGRFHVLVFGCGGSEDFYLKGYDIAAHAVAELCKREKHIFKLVFVGVPNGEEEKVKEMLLKEGIPQSQLIVRSYKEREQLAAQFCEADLAIMPSRSEGFGLAALKALSAGLPVLVSGNSGLGGALKELPFGSSCVVNSEDANEWAKAIHTIHVKKRKLRLREAVRVRESYAEEYHWEGECGRLVERMLNIIQETSTAPDQAVAAVNLMGEQVPSSVSEAVFHPDATTIQQHTVGDVGSSGRENVIQGERPRTHTLNTTEGRQRLNAGISERRQDVQCGTSEDQESLTEYGVSYIRLSIQGRNLGKEKKEAMEEISTLITQAYDKFSIHSRSGVEGFKSLTDHLIDAYAVRLVTVRKGSIVIILECPTLESLEHLWSDYRSGHLDKVAERYLVTDKIKKKLNLETICLETTIDEENYLNCKKALMKLPSPCSENPGKGPLHPSETTSPERESQNTDTPETIVTSSFKAVVGLLVNKASDSAAEKLKEVDVTDTKIQKLIQREIEDIKSKLDALSRKDLLSAIGAFEAGVRYLYQALEIGPETVRSATSTKETLMNATKAPALTAAIERGIKNVGFTEFGAEAKRLLLQAKERFEMTREKATQAFNNEALDTLQRVTATRYRVMAAMLESVAMSLAATTDLSSLSRESALQSATPEFEQSLRQLHSLPDVKKNFEVELRNGLFSIRRRSGRNKRRKIICAVCQVNRFIYDAQEFDFDHYDWAAIKIGEKSINPLYSREVVKLLEKCGMQHCCIRILWSFGHNGEKGHRLKGPSRIATNTYGEFLVVDNDDTIKVFNSSGEFICKINRQVDDSKRGYHVTDIATAVNNDTYILVELRKHGIYRGEVQVFTKTEMCNRFPVGKGPMNVLTVGHDRVFVGNWCGIDVYDLNGIDVCSFGEGTLSHVIDVAAGSDGQIFVLDCKLTNEEKFAHVFTEDGHQQNNFRVDSEEDDYSCLASYPSGEHIVFSGFERKTRRLKVAMYRKDGAFNRSVTLDQRLCNPFSGEWYGQYCISGIAVTNDGSVAISFRDQENQRKVIVRHMKPC